MSAIAQSSGSSYPAVQFSKIGDAVAGRIVAFEDYQEIDFDTKQPAFYAKSGDPIMGTKVHLETSPGDEGSRVTLWCKGKRMMGAVATALRKEGASDLEVGADLAVTHTGMDGRAKDYQAAYSRPAEQADEAPF